MNCWCVWICARRDIDLPWLILLACCWCAKRASEHFLTISPLFFLSLSTRERARSHTYIQTRCDEDERVWASISFYLKTRETLNKESIHLLFFSSSSSSCHKHVQNGQILRTIQLRLSYQNEKVRKKRKYKTWTFFPRSLYHHVSIYLLFRNWITFFSFEWNQIQHILWVITYTFVW